MTIKEKHQYLKNHGPAILARFRSFTASRWADFSMNQHARLMMQIDSFYEAFSRLDENPREYTKMTVHSMLPIISTMEEFGEDTEDLRNDYQTLR